MPRTLNNSYQELVKKAQYLFWTQGYKTVSPKELAEHLGVSVSTIYNKYTKEMLFLDALEDYVVSCSDPVLCEIRESEEGIESFRMFFNKLIEALLNKTFPRSCLIVNTVVELRNEEPHVTEVYKRYFKNMIDCYTIVLNRAYDLGEIKQRERIDEYAEFLVGVIFGLGILYKVKTRKELEDYVDEQLSLLE